MSELSPQQNIGCVFIDTHAHLDFPDFSNDREEVLARARAAGIGNILTVGTCLESSRDSIRLAEMYPEIYAAVGIHPNHVSDSGPTDMDDIASLAAHARVRAIGETGLDFFRDHTSPEDQRRVFLQHLEIATTHKKPFILHSRQSGEACLDIIETFMKDAPDLMGVFHCFTDTEHVLLRALELGLHIGISGIVTFPKGDNVRACVPLIPDDRLVLDTDSPFLTPPPHRGKRNEPCHAPLIAESLAAIRHTDVAHIARITTANAQRLFGLPPV